MKIIEEYNSVDSALIEIKSADYIGDFVIRITFNDGVSRVVDFKSFLETSYHPSIRKFLDERKFKEFQIIDGNLNWNDYDLIFPIYDLYQGRVQKKIIDTYLKNKRFNVKSKPKEMTEIDDLILAYHFAIKNKLSKKSFLASHKILSNTVLSLKSQKGKLRNQQVGIFSGRKVEYMAVEPEFVEEEFDKLFFDIRELLSRNLSHKEIFYYASMTHLLFEKIHPFMDGNGRAGRLLEKWFLSEKLGENAWSIQSEKYYAKHREEYYQKIHIGYDYYTLKMERCVPFLLMLPMALQSA